MAIEITGKQFNPKTIKRFVVPQFEKQGLVFAKEDPEIARRLQRESGATLTHVTFPLKSGLKLKLGIKFDIDKGKILPDSKGLIYNAKLGANAIPLAKPKGEDYDWTSFIKKIADHVKKKEETYKPKPPSVPKSQATDDKIPNTFAAKVEAKKAQRDEKKAELTKQQKALEDQNKENERLESEIEGFKGSAEKQSQKEDVSTKGQDITRARNQINELKRIITGKQFEFNSDSQKTYYNKLLTKYINSFDKEANTAIEEIESGDAEYFDFDFEDFFGMVTDKADNFEDAKKEMTENFSSVQSAFSFFKKLKIPSWR